MWDVLLILTIYTRFLLTHKMLADFLFPIKISKSWQYFHVIIFGQNKDLDFLYNLFFLFTQDKPEFRSIIEHTQRTFTRWWTHDRCDSSKFTGYTIRSIWKRNNKNHKNLIYRLSWNTENKPRGNESVVCVHLWAAETFLGLFSTDNAGAWKKSILENSLNAG